MKEENRNTEKLYDLSELREMSDNNQDFINRMIYMFIQNSEKTVDEFNTLVPQEKWTEIGEAAHKILPSYRHLQVNHIVDLLTQIKEKTLIDSDYNEIPLLVDSTIEKIEKLIPELKREMN